MDTNGNYLKNSIVPYIIAIELKRLGFNEKCFAFYDEDKKPMHFSQVDVFWNSNTDIQYVRKLKNLFKGKKVKDIMCLAPTWDQVTKWFLAKKIYVTYTPIFINRALGLSEIDCYVPHCNFDYLDMEYKTSKEAYTEAISIAINILKDKSIFKENGI